MVRSRKLLIDQVHVPVDVKVKAAQVFFKMLTAAGAEQRRHVIMAAYEPQHYRRNG